MRRALGALALLAVATVLGGCCDKGQRIYVIDAPDPDLAAMLQACIDAPPCPATGDYPYCTPEPCRTACRRVSELGGDTRAGDSLVECHVRPYMDGGTAIWISVSYDTCK